MSSLILHRNLSFLYSLKECAPSILGRALPRDHVSAYQQRAVKRRCLVKRPILDQRPRGRLSGIDGHPFIRPLERDSYGLTPLSLHVTRLSNLAAYLRLILSRFISRSEVSV